MNTTYMLSDLGHEITEASSAANALRLLENGDKFDLVITDFAMPGMNGLDLALQIRSKDRNLPIILATGYAEMPGGKVSEFPRLAKPYTHDQLSEMIVAVMTGRVRR
jgi:CheY-like chemotaxis protein